MAIAFVQSKTANSGASSVATLDIVLDAAPTEGNIVVLVASAALPLQILSTSGITWMGTSGLGSTNTVTILGVGRVFSGASATITVATNAGGTCPIVIAAAEYSGVNIRVDRAAFATANSTTAASGDSSTTSVANELWIGAIGHRFTNGATFSSPTNSFTIVVQDKTSAGTSSDRSVALLERIVTSTGVANAGATISSSGIWTAMVRTFHEQPAAGQTSHTFG